MNNSTTGPPDPSTPNSNSATAKLPSGVDPKLSTDVDPKTLRQAIAGSALGNAVEWFDYGVYGYMTVYMAKLFFGGEEGDGGLGVIFALATLSLSFFVRPIGGIVLGPLGDKVGRQKVLVLTITMMTLATGAIGLLPTMDTIGIAAPILLLLLRLVQGFSTGGEYGGAAVFMSEYAPDKRRGFFGAFLEFGTLAGTIVAALLCTVLISIVGDDGMLSGWWRLPFLCTIPLGLTALWLRTRLKEPPVFQEASTREQTSKRPFIDLIKDHWPRLLVLTGFVLLLNVAYYLILVYMPSYLSATLGHDTAMSNYMLVAIMAVMLLIINPLGALSDKVGRKYVLAVSAVLFIVLSVPAMMLVNTSSPALQLLGLAILGVLLVVLMGSVSSTLPAIFPTHVRYSGFAVGYNISTAIFGGTAATVVAWLVRETGNNLIPGWYLVAAGVVGLIAVLCMRETAQATLRGDDIPGRADSTGLPNIKYVNDNRSDTEAITGEVPIVGESKP